MLRSVAQRFVSVARSSVHRPILGAASVRCSSHGPVETDEQFDARYETYFNRADIDGWEIRKGMNDLQAMDMVPEPKIIAAAMRACRRVNDYALAVRYLEAVQDKCGNRVGTIWPFIEQQIKPTLDDLGILTPEQMGYDKPELALQSVYDMH